MCYKCARGTVPPPWVSVSAVTGWRVPGGLTRRKRLRSYVLQHKHRKLFVWLSGFMLFIYSAPFFVHLSVRRFLYASTGVDNRLRGHGTVLRSELMRLGSHVSVLPSSCRTFASLAIVRLFVHLLSMSMSSLPSIAIHSPGHCHLIVLSQSANDCPVWFTFPAIRPID